MTEDAFKMSDKDEIVDAELVEDEVPASVEQVTEEQAEVGGSLAHVDHDAPPIQSIGTLETPQFPVPDEADGEFERVMERRVDGLRIGDELVQPVKGLVLSVELLPSARVRVKIDDGVIRERTEPSDGVEAPVYEVNMDERCLVVTPKHRPGDPLDDQAMRALGRANPQLRASLVETAL